MKNVIQNLYKLERKYENLLDEHQEIREDQEIEEEELLSDCIKLAEELPKSKLERQYENLYDGSFYQYLCKIRTSMNIKRLGKIKR